MTSSSYELILSHATRNSTEATLRAREASPCLRRCRCRASHRSPMHRRTSTATADRRTRHSLCTADAVGVGSRRDCPGVTGLRRQWSVTAQGTASAGYTRNSRGVHAAGGYQVGPAASGHGRDAAASTEHSILEEEPCETNKQVSPLRWLLSNRNKSISCTYLIWLGLVPI